MSAEESSSLKFYLGLQPVAGDLIPGAGGVRKLRWAIGTRGRKENLSQKEKAELKAIIKSIRNEYRKGL